MIVLHITLVLSRMEVLINYALIAHLILLHQSRCFDTLNLQIQFQITTHVLQALTVFLIFDSGAAEDRIANDAA